MAPDPSGTASHCTGPEHISSGQKDAWGGTESEQGTVPGGLGQGPDQSIIFGNRDSFDLCVSAEYHRVPSDQLGIVYGLLLSAGRAAAGGASGFFPGYCGSAVPVVL